MFWSARITRIATATTINNEYKKLNTQNRTVFFLQTRQLGADMLPTTTGRITTPRQDHCLQEEATVIHTTDLTGEPTTKARTKGTWLARTTGSSTRMPAEWLPLRPFIPWRFCIRVTTIQQGTVAMKPTQQLHFTILIRLVTIETKRKVWRSIVTIETGISKVIAESLNSHEKEAILGFYRPQTKLRNGYVFTPVCHSVHGGWGLSAPVHAGIYRHLGRQPPGRRPLSCPVHAGIHMATAADGTHPTGMHSCFSFFFAQLLWFLLFSLV